MTVTYDDIAEAEAATEAARLHSNEQHRILHEYAQGRRPDDPAVAGDAHYEYLLGQSELAHHRYEQERMGLARLRDRLIQQQAREAQTRRRQRTRSR